MSASELENYEKYPLKQPSYERHCDRMPATPHQIDIMHFLGREIGVDPETMSCMSFDYEMRKLTRSEASCIIDDLACELCSRDNIIED